MRLLLASVSNDPILFSPEIERLAAEAGIKMYLASVSNDPILFSLEAERLAFGYTQHQRVMTLYYLD